ncbi:hypothetical protein MVEN_02388200 [Mycena venus]|uniref:RapZ C-terminal domain-containing protein n=1 Tax=Mycena venus TaxID=2733690 RepID=A0A8H6X229_9AGAR|nr:hypothetical protein MVEN_02388200 [Mycena venus]
MPSDSGATDSDLNSLHDSDEIPPNPNHEGNTDESAGGTMGSTTLYLTSHGHRFGPFTPALSPGVSELKVLQYDIRSLPNPPKNVRAQQTGLYKSLREWFFSRPEAVTKLEEVCADIDNALTEVFASDVSSVEIHIVVFCEMGKHRSVAFVEELSRRAFLVETEDGRKKCPVVVQHRDVTRGKHADRRRRQRADDSE